MHVFMDVSRYKLDASLRSDHLSKVDIPPEARERILERLRAYRTDLENRIAFLESGRAQVRVEHDGEWIDGTQPTVTNLYRQYGDLGALLNDIVSGRI
jgi:hypothetical protein